ncbi:hypothetical protein N7509_000454 [Penicillium cosmopolitanum]|uniref:Uncharacterized protein n=1 Tax=Penicillium cosmopolitanum TaxID=1131564 RepID=A0A9W9WAL6_9EURO|nr:uncharacterized protein N7509_000454 [Penicillium cosmopolitanum]KAJ5413827.1 hypothetical protein N7509_000454 [Penicillium cosmopolitanum]
MPSTTAVLTVPVELPPPSGPRSLISTLVYDVTKSEDERRQTLNELLIKGHDSMAPLREPRLILHSHLPHLLGSGYILGASSNYTVAYVDFFDNQVKINNGDWKAVLQQYLFSGAEPLINGLVGGLGHPFIHLAYVWELQSPTVATEGLSLGCTEYIPLHGILDRAPPDNSSYKSSSLAEVLSRVQADKRLASLFTKPGITNINILLEKRYSVLLEHWNAWEVTDPLQQLEQCCDLSLLLGIGTGNGAGQYDFYLIHTMTVAQAIRQYALFLLLIYICQMKPEFPTKIIQRIDSIDLGGHDWSWVMAQALEHRWAKDSHFFKVVRAPKAFEDAFGRKSDHYLKASVKFISEFNGWNGFGEGVAGYLPDRDGFHPDKE